MSLLLPCEKYKMVMYGETFHFKIFFQMFHGCGTDLQKMHNGIKESCGVLFMTSITLSEQLPIIREPEPKPACSASFAYIAHFIPHTTSKHH
jgi:hypothetical protein